jgi:transposase
MATRLITIDRDTPLLLAPDMRQWVPAKHLVHFILDAVDELDLRSARLNERGTGDKQYPPGMMLALLIYGYACGMFSSRQIERATYENVAVRVLCGDTHPDHDTICAFRRNNAELLAKSFAQVLEMAARCGVLKVGGITVAIDGTKVLANASKHAAVSYERAGEQMRELDLEIGQLLRKAEEADSAPLEDGLSIPQEVQRRVERKAALAKARAEMEARAYARAQAERADYERKVREREQARQDGGKPRGKEPRAPQESPEAKDQYNFTDPQSRIMKASGGNHFEQSYNAQAAVEIESRLIVGKRVSDAANDKEELVPSFGAIEPCAGPVAAVLIDSGYVSESAVTQVERDKAGAPTGTLVLAAIVRQRHGRSVQDLEKKGDPPAPGPEAPFAERMNHRVATRAGRERYKARRQTVEPVFGIIKAAMGFRRFSMRGLQKVSLEWTLVSLAYNLKRLFSIGAKLASA